MPLIPFPDVPPYPGVPQLAGNVPEPVQRLLTSDSPGLSGLTTAPQWGIYLDDTLAIQPDSFVNLDFSKEYNVASFPVEQGSFANYNKVGLPYEQKIAMAKGGTDSDRSDFERSLQQALESLNLYTVITPGAVYTNANIVRVSYSRSAQNGVSLLVAEISIQEIRVAGDLTFKNTASPSGASLENGGPVQSTTPTAQQSNAAAGGIQ